MAHPTDGLSQFLLMGASKELFHKLDREYLGPLPGNGIVLYGGVDIHCQAGQDDQGILFGDEEGGEAHLIIKIELGMID